MTYVEHLEPMGIRRHGTPQTGFDYRFPDGRKVPAREVARIKSLKIPPAWKDVRIHPSGKARLQAIGKDKAGRWQYRYHEAFRRSQDSKKFERLIRFAEALPRMRARIARDMKRPRLDFDKVMACVLKILSSCFIRPGSQVYADEHGSFGLATLRPEHVRVLGERVECDFRGKSGKHQHRELCDAQVARVVRQLLKVPAREVFKFQDDDGAWVDVKRRHINRYIKDVMGDAFSAKDFRTWAGTLICASALARSGVQPGDSERRVKRKMTAAIKETAHVLGNTPSVCRSSYIFPSVLSSFESGRVVERYFDTVAEIAEVRANRLGGPERALVDFLRREAGAAASALRRAGRGQRDLTSTLKASVAQAARERLH